MNPSKEMLKAQEREQYNQFKLSYSQIVNITGPLTTSNMMQYFMFLESSDSEKLTSNIRSTLKYFMASSVLGAVANRMVTKLDMVAKAPFLLRLPVRTALFFLPNLLFVYQYNSIFQSNNDMWRKYGRRIDSYLKTGEFSYLDPQGEVYKQVLRNAMAFENKLN